MGPELFTGNRPARLPFKIDGEAWTCPAKAMGDLFKVPGTGAAALGQRLHRRCVEGPDEFE